MKTISKIELSEKIKREAQELGFSFCGISKAELLSNEATKLEEWLKNQKHGEMAYMENHFDLRVNPALLFNGAKSIITLGYNYFSDESQVDSTAPKISKYAYGKDYHKVLKKKLLHFFEWMKLEIGESLAGRVFVDSAPLLEKAIAAKAGVGWVGKNSNIINRQLGSFFFLCEIVLDLELNYDAPIKDYCGSCTRCIDACPTQAISEPYKVDGSKCISYFTIELKKQIPESYEGKFDNWMFGCDVCQDVCPWNRFSIQNNEPKFKPKAELLKMNKKEWEELTEEVFDKVFEGSAVKRTKYEGLIRNIAFVRKKE